MLLALLNGTLLAVKNMYANALDLEILTGVKSGRRVLCVGISKSEFIASGSNYTILSQKKTISNKTGILYDNKQSP